jgi:hypothetical protein
VESDSSQASSKSPNKFSGQLVTCDPQVLRPHPSYARHGLAVSADELSAVRATGNIAFLEPRVFSLNTRQLVWRNVAENEFLFFLYIKSAGSANSEA